MTWSDHHQHRVGVERLESVAAVTRNRNGHTASLSGKPPPAMWPWSRSTRRTRRSVALLAGTPRRTTARAKRCSGVVPVTMKPTPT